MSADKLGPHPIASDSFHICTPRLTLRPPSESDAAELFPLVSDARLTKFLAWEPHRAIEETREMLKSLIQSQQSGAGYHWMVLANGRLVGLVSLIDVRRSHRTWTLDRAELAYWVGCPFQGLGYATEAARAVVEYGLQALRLHKIRVYHASDNPTSGRTVEKLGFRFVGEEIDAFCKEQEWHSLKHFEMLATDLYFSPNL
jgi:ribosomal-protein-alanine N-acetyltransferase